MRVLVHLIYHSIINVINSSPALYQKYQSASPQAVDEWTLSEAMAADTASGGLNQLETHYQTFIVCHHLSVPRCLYLILSIDRARLCTNRRGWTQLCANSSPILGNRDSFRRTFPRQDLLEVSIAMIRRLFFD